MFIYEDSFFVRMNFEKISIKKYTCVKLSVE